MDYRFSESDSADRLRGYFLKLLETESATLSPEQINRWSIGPFRAASNWPSRSMDESNSTPRKFPTSVWRKIADQLRPRWKAIVDKSDSDEKHLLSEGCD